ncbi:MAG: lysophospholipid acyltransferase family protein [Verrucomicrobiaceae bacterium]
MAQIHIDAGGRILAWIIRTIGKTLRWDIRDDAGVFDESRRGWIWSFWHNRMFLVPWMHEKWFAHIPGTMLTSPSRDGRTIAEICESFGIEAERGSSSSPEKGMSALIALAKKSREGYEIGITPDGPRGPPHRVQPGIIKLAQITGTPIIPVHMHFSHSIQLDTWDKFLLPLPFATVRLVFDKPHHIPRRLTEEEFEERRLALEEVMNAGSGVCWR